MVEAISFVGALGCYVEVPEESTGSAAIVQGTSTWDRSEVGMLRFLPPLSGYCTATLIRSNVAITAAHCLRYASEQSEGRYGSLMIQTGEWSSEWYLVDKYASLGGSLGFLDVALVHLGQHVPVSIATPAELSTRTPALGEIVEGYGFGCDAVGRADTGARKRKATFAYGQRQVLCSGDSGGPLFISSSRALAMIHSATYRARSGATMDLFAAPHFQASAIEDQISAWEVATIGGGGAADGPECLGSAEAAGAVAVSSTTSGRVCRHRDSWFRIPALRAHSIDARLSFVHAAGDLDMKLHAVDGSLLASSEGVSNQESVTHTASEDADFFLRAYGWQGAANTATLSVSVIP